MSILRRPENSNDDIPLVWLFGAALLMMFIGMIGFWFGFLTPGRAILLLALSAILAVFTSVVALPRALDWFNSPTVREVLDANMPDVLDDEVEQLRSGVPPRSLFMIGALAAIGVAYVYSVLAYGKLWNAYWEGLPVIIPTAGFGFMLYALIKRTNWYHHKRTRTNGFFYSFIVIMAVLSLMGGVYYTEPVTPEGLTQSEQDAIALADRGSYDYDRTRSSYFYYNYWNPFWYDSSPSVSPAPSSSGGSSASSCKNCGAAILLILGIVLAFIVLVASCLVPHFWVLGLPLLLIMLYLMSKHELKRDRRWG